MLRKLLLAATVLMPVAAGAQPVPAPVSASSPALAPFFRAPTPLVWQLGDSRFNIMNQAVTTNPGPFYLVKSGSVVGWARRLLGPQRFNPDLSQGYSGANATPQKVVIVPNNHAMPLGPGNGSGTGYSSSSTCSGSGGTYSSPTVDSNGGILAISILSTTGVAQSSVPVISCTGGTGLNAIAQLSGTGVFGGSGEQTSQILQQVPDLLAVAKPGDIVVVWTGGNDDVNNVPIATSLADAKLLADKLLAAGLYVVWVQELPRLVWNGNQDANATATQWRKQMQARRHYIQAYALQDALKNGNAYPHFSVVDAYAETHDGTNAYDDPIAGVLVDGVHQGARGAYDVGYKLAQVLDKLLPAPSTTLPNAGCADVYDATYNPAGTITANPCLTGTTGAMPATAGALTVSGTAPTSYTVQVGTASGAVTLAGSQETPRADGLTGVRPQFVLTCGSSGSANQTLTLKNGGATIASMGLTSATNASASPPRLQFDVDLEVSGQANLKGISATLGIYDSAGSSQYSAGDGDSGTTGAPLANAGVYDGAIPPLGAGMTIHLTTQPIVLNNIGTTAGTMVSFIDYITATVDCSGAAASSGAVTLRVSHFSPHLVS